MQTNDPSPAATFASQAQASDNPAAVAVATTDPPPAAPAAKAAPKKPEPKKGTQKGKAASVKAKGKGGKGGKGGRGKGAKGTKVAAKKKGSTAAVKKTAASKAKAKAGGKSAAALEPVNPMGTVAESDHTCASPTHEEKEIMTRFSLHPTAGYRAKVLFMEGEQNDKRSWCALWRCFPYPLRLNPPEGSAAPMAAVHSCRSHLRSFSCGPLQPHIFLPLLRRAGPEGTRATSRASRTTRGRAATAI